MVSVLDGSPDLSRYCEEILVGVKDTIRPKQYGKELPLKDSVLFGEEMSILFTEKLDCSFPLKFDVSLTIEDFNEAGDEELKKSNNDLQVSAKVGTLELFLIYLSWETSKTFSARLLLLR